MVMGFIFGLMDQNMSDSFHLIRNMEKVYMTGMMVVNFRADGIEDLDKGKESIHLKMDTKEKASGEPINELNGSIELILIDRFYVFIFHLLLK